MDPDEALKKAREAAKGVIEGLSYEHRGQPSVEDYAGVLAEAFEALDEWLSKGGFLPDDWRRKDGGT